MPDHDPALDDAIREIANLLATAYLRRIIKDALDLGVTHTRTRSCVPYD